MIARLSGTVLDLGTDSLVVDVVDVPKGSSCSTDERVTHFTKAMEEYPNVTVKSFNGLTVELARSESASVLVRGIRAVTGFEAEFDMALMNKKMAPEIESVYLMASHEHLYISASRIREIATLGHPVDDLVPPVVAQALTEKFKHAQPR